MRKGSLSNALGRASSRSVAISTDQPQISPRGHADSSATPRNAQGRAALFRRMSSKTGFQSGTPRPAGDVTTPRPLESYYTAIEDEDDHKPAAKPQAFPSFTKGDEFMPCSTEVRQLLFWLQGSARRLQERGCGGLEVMDIMAFASGLLPKTEVLATTIESELERLPDGGGAIFTLRCFLRHAQRCLRLLEAALPSLESTKRVAKERAPSEQRGAAGGGADAGDAERPLVQQERGMLERLGRKLRNIEPLVLNEVEFLSDSRQVP